MLELWNIKLFLLINASSGLSKSALLLPLFFAKYLVMIGDVFLVMGWVCGSTSFRQATLMTLITCIIGLMTNYVIGHFYFHPRPFMVPLGNCYYSHKVASSFPSNHMTFSWALAIIYLLSSRQRLFGVGLAIMALLTGWSRVYIGVHFPFDIIGSIIVATIIGLIVYSCRNFINQKIFPPIEGLYLTIFVRPFKRIK